MASRDNTPPKTPAPQSIPLRNLSRPPDDEHSPTNRGGSNLQATLSPRHGRTGSLLSRASRHSNYSRLNEESPTREDRSPVSPLADLHDFVSASIGLSFTGPSTPQNPNYRPPIITTSTDEELHDSHSILSPQDDDDLTPLTNNTGLKPPTTRKSTRKSDDGNERGSIRSSLQWVDGSSPSRGRGLSSRLGDDLPTLSTNFDLNRKSSSASNNGTLASDSHRYLDPSSSLSPSASPLARAGSIFREISERVVNISNDSDMVEQRLRRKSTDHRPRHNSAVSAISLGSIGANDIEGLGITGNDLHHPIEKTPSIEAQPEIVFLTRPVRRQDPLRGKSWGIFGPENPLRKWLLEVLTHPFLEPIILILIVAQTVLLAVTAATNAVYQQDLSRNWGDTGFDYAIFGLFCIYTIEIISRTIVSGFIINPTEYSTIDRSDGFIHGVKNKVGGLFSMHHKSPDPPRKTSVIEFQPSIVRSFTGLPDVEGPGHGRQQQRIRLSRRAFLRHSFNRLDFVAVVAYWISFAMQVTNVQIKHHIFVFEMLSCLRILRLLGLTAGTTIILRSLKKAAPLLVNVAFLIGFFWLIFGIVGVQSFKSSFRRTCVWVGDDGFGQNYSSNIAPNNIQFCGGYLNASSGQPWPWLRLDGSNGTSSPKGYLCPVNSLCVESFVNPYNNTVSFDNIFQSLELVFVIISSNTWSDLMYYLADSDYLSAALFFAVGIVVLSLWLVNLLVAVITSSFQIIREESKQSAFTTETIEEHPALEENSPTRGTQLKRIFNKTKLFWVLIIAVDLVVMCLRSASMSQWREEMIMTTETVVTLLLLIEIILRFLCDWRHFFLSKRNWTDLIIAIITSVMQIPPIRNSGQPYMWLTFFQIIRVYRLVLAPTVTRELVMIVFGNAIGLLNLIVFVFLFTFLAGILASQFFRGEIPVEDAGGNPIQIQFFDIWNSFIGMYITLSSENWTTILYNVTQFDRIWNTAWLGALFNILWFIMANMIVLNMFIAVIQESFDVSEDEKRLQQVKAFLKQKEASTTSGGNLALSSIFKFGRDSFRHRDALQYGGLTLEQLLKDAVVSDFLDDHHDQQRQRPISMHLSSLPVTAVTPSFLSSLWIRIFGPNSHRDPNPFYSQDTLSRANEEFDARAVAKKVASTTENRRRAQRQYLIKHPRYNVSLFIFKPQNRLRRLCQYLVGPGRGDERVEGVSPWPPAQYSFAFFTYAAIVAMVILACITTPLYQREYFRNGTLTNNWFVWTDLAFAAVFTVEAIIKTIADGFYSTPHAYFRSIWGLIDVVVMLSLWISVVTSFYREDSISRGVGAFKALRALRLLNISDQARDTFHSVIVIGGYKVLSAAFVSLSLLIPFAILGVNLFNGKFESCNDGNLSGVLDNCVGEFNSTPFNWPVLAPRAVSNPQYSFDDFPSALFILFQIVSQEGWTGVLQSGMDITGKGLQPQNFASQGNAIYFIIFNLLGAVFVLTLFISVFMRNYTEQTGVAYLTAEQRSWLELRKILKQITPSKKSLNDSSRRWEMWCYKVASKKRGTWPRIITTLLLFHLTLLVIEFYPEPPLWEQIREYIFFVLTLVFFANMIMRLIGKGWVRFRRSSWDMFSLVAVPGTFITSILALLHMRVGVIDQLHKLFLVSITFLLIPRNNQLDQLFKTAAASLPLIGNLLATWFVLFLVYAIALTQAFALTRFGPNESGNVNFRTVPKALILLFRTSIGEGWNTLMEDFAGITPPFCVIGPNFFESDCGSQSWARGLFVSWNIISMYIFVSLFVSLIFESFSYVYQRSSGLSIVSRDEIRRFKHAWADYDPKGTGYISKQDFPRLLGKLSGVFQMRIYEGDFSVHKILDESWAREGERPSSGVRVVAGINLDKLNKLLDDIPVQEIKARRTRMDVFYHEVLQSADPDRGVAFTTCLMILAHYNVITDNKSLRLEEFLRRRARLQRVHESIRRDTVVGFIDTIYWSRRFRKAIADRRRSRSDGPPQIPIPEIFVENPDDSPDSGDEMTAHDFTETAPLQSPQRMAPNLPRINTVAAQADSTRSSLSPRDISPGSSPVQLTNRLHSTDTTYHGRERTPPQTPSLGGHSRNTSNASALGAQGVMESFDASAWGESIRRSFTAIRRSHQSS